MRSDDQGPARLFAIIAGEINAADDARRAVAETAFDRLRTADPELAPLAIQALHSHKAAAAFFARKFVYTDHGSSYAALADGKRDLVVARLGEFIAGEAGGYV